MNIIGHKGIFLTISSVLVTASIVAIALFGFRPGVDFTGGTLWQIKTDNQSVNETTLKDFFVSQLNFKDIVVYKELVSQSYIMKLPAISEADHQKYFSALNEKFGKIDEQKFQSIGPTVGAGLKTDAIRAIIFVLIGISLYIAFAFRKASYPVQSWKYGIATLIALMHDVVIPSGVIAVLGHFAGVEMDTNFVVALLVIMGFSVHDTIVVFDRVRENLLTRKGSKSFSEIVNDSVVQTLVRSINTSLTLVLVLTAMLIFGAPTLKLFVLIMLVGVIFGTYSSIFIASPILTIWYKFGKNK
jgi:preprotein translocase subunit SecF